MEPLDYFYKAKGFTPTREQRRAVNKTKLPLLIIAGPGSGKTRVLLWRTFNLIVYKNVTPESILLCTFTEKAADQLRLGLENLIDMLDPAVSKGIDLSEMPIGTIHSICARFLRENVRDWRLSMKNFVVLDEITQFLFAYDKRNFEYIRGDQRPFNSVINQGGTSRTRCIMNLIAYLNKLTEERIDADAIIDSTCDQRLKVIAAAFKRYEDLLDSKNRVDFAHLQTKFYDLLRTKTGKRIKDTIKYVMVDEYQDTNYIQELIFFNLARHTKNLCVVGDEDQSIYRFRGATVQNLIDFERTCRRKLGIKPMKVSLTKNFRSHERIIDTFNIFMESYSGWTVGRRAFRYPGKRVVPGLKKHLPYPACCQIVTSNETEMAKNIAEFVQYLLRKRIVDDPSNIAILMKSIKNQHFDEIARQLEKLGIDYYAPRAGKFFECPEVRQVIGAFLLLLDWHRDETDWGNYGKYMDWLEEVRDESYGLLRKEYPKSLRVIRGIRREFARLVDDYRKLSTIFGLGMTSTLEDVEDIGINIKVLSETERRKVRELLRKRGRRRLTEKNIRKTIALDKGLIDYFYLLLGIEPFRSYMAGEQGQGKIRNLATFSNIISMFQEHRMHRIITAVSLLGEWLQQSFVNNFLYLIYQQELNEYEDRTAIVPKGAVPIMTIHQAKGLEFPVVIIGRLHVRPRPQLIEMELRPFMRRRSYEPEDETPLFDHMRLFYVAMSRAMNLLVMPNLQASHNKPHRTFTEVLDYIPTLTSKDFPRLAGLRFRTDTPNEFKPSFGFKSDFQYYRTCPRQYEVFRYYSFAPARSNELFFGTLVHQTIDDIHSIYLNAPSKDEVVIGETEIETLFRNNYETLRGSGLHPLSPATQDAALRQVKEYFLRSQDLIKNVYRSELRLLQSQGRYNITGVVDIIANPDGEYHLYDFKAQRMDDIRRDLAFFEDQLNLYYHILTKTYGIEISRMFIYSTSTDKGSDDGRLHEVSISKRRVAGLMTELDGIARRIMAGDFRAEKEKVGKRVCARCELSSFCKR